jgi:glycosyltransferase involved in cell wall biosynthesis
MPRISVLLPVYNGEAFLKEAIESILNQTFRDFELIIISEFGTSPKSKEIINDFNDNRIIHISNATKLGLAGSLNSGASIATGEYLARMDGDDVADWKRFELQVAFLDEHPQIDAVGSACTLIDANGKSIGKMNCPRYPLTISIALWLDNPIAHPTVMMKRSIFQSVGGYDSTKDRSEDYWLWLRLNQTTSISNLKKALLKYRVHGENVSLQQATRTKNSAFEAANSLWTGSSNGKMTLAILRDEMGPEREGDAYNAARTLVEIRRRAARGENGCRERIEADAYCSFVWISLFFKAVGGIRERANIVKTGLKEMGSASLIAFPLGLRPHIRHFLKRQKRI